MSGARIFCLMSILLYASVVRLVRYSVHFEIVRRKRLSSLLLRCVVASQITTIRLSDTKWLGWKAPPIVDETQYI